MVWLVLFDFFDESGYNFFTMSPLPGVIINGQGDMRLSDGTFVTAGDLWHAEDVVREVNSEFARKAMAEAKQYLDEEKIQEGALTVAVKVARRRQESE